MPVHPLPTIASKVHVVRAVSLPPTKCSNRQVRLVCLFVTYHSCHSNIAIGPAPCGGFGFYQCMQHVINRQHVSRQCRIQHTRMLAPVPQAPCLRQETSNVRSHAASHLVASEVLGCNRKPLLSVARVCLFVTYHSWRVLLGCVLDQRPARGLQGGLMTR